MCVCVLLCFLQGGVAAQLMVKCSNLQHLALSGCAGVTDAIWQQVEGAQMQQLAVGQRGCEAPAGTDAALMDVDALGSSQAGGDGSTSGSVSSSNLQSLSLVRCSNLRSLCLGLLPASGRVELLGPKHYLIAADRAALQAGPHASPDGSWVQVPSAVSELTSLKLGLSGVQVVALALPKLSHLDLSSCKHLRVLELRCPLLLQLQLQACRSLPVVSAVKGVLSSPHLQMLDVQHMLPLPGSNSRRSSDEGHAEDGAEVEEMAGGCGAGGVVAPVAATPATAASSGSSLLAAVAASGVLPAGSSTGVQAGLLLDELATTHSSLRPEGVLRCTSLCRVCSKLQQCSL